jgi:hypothetical protein
MALSVTASWAAKERTGQRQIRRLTTPAPA